MLVAMLCHQQLTAHVCYSRCMRNRKAVLKNILRQSVWALFIRFTFSCFLRHLDLLLVNTHFGQLKKHPEFYIILKNLVSKKWDGCCFVLVTSDPKPVGSRMKKLDPSFAPSACQTTSYFEDASGFSENGDLQKWIFPPGENAGVTLCSNPERLLNSQLGLCRSKSDPQDICGWNQIALGSSLNWLPPAVATGRSRRKGHCVGDGDHLNKCPMRKNDVLNVEWGNYEAEALWDVPKNGECWSIKRIKSNKMSFLVYFQPYQFIPIYEPQVKHNHWKSQWFPGN